MLLRRLRWGLAGALVAWTLIRAFGLDRVWPLVPLLAFTPHVTVLALIGAGLAVWRRWWAGAAVVGACSLVLGVLLAPRAIPDTAPASARGVRLRVLAANVAGNAAAAHSVLRDVRRWHVDVFSAVELSPQVARAYDENGARSMFPDRALHPLPGFTGTGLYSRLALRRLAPPPGTLFGMSAAEARLPGAAPVELVAVHVPAPTTPAATTHWHHDMHALPSAGGAAPLRVLAGDFNATLDHVELRRLLDRGYRDAAEQAGVALRPTWPRGQLPLPTLITIDHVLADRRIRVLAARSVAISGSDHRGVIADLLLPDADRGGG
jgi:endonuclease/exonuclease/phosphatase (EEP) superfamily protein YafD